MGSWGSGEFHLTLDGATSYSDVDAASISAEEHQEDTVLLTSSTQPIPLRLSIHRRAYRAEVTRRGQAILSLLNIAVALRQNQPPQVIGYEISKAYLSAFRTSPSQTYTDAAAALGETGRAALNVKLGVLELPDVPDDYPAWQAMKRIAEELTDTREPISIRLDSALWAHRFLTLLEQATSEYPDWLRRYALNKYMGRLGPSVAPTSLGAN